METQTVVATTTRPKDKYFLTYVTCIMVGIGSLMPYTCLLSSSDYFQINYKLIDNIVLKMMILLNIFNFAGIAFLIPFNYLISIKTRIIICNVITGIVFVIIVVFNNNYLLIWFISCICGISCGTLCVSIISYAQLFSPKYVL